MPMPRIGARTAWAAALIVVFIVVAVEVFRWQDNERPRTPPESRAPDLPTRIAHPGKVQGPRIVRRNDERGGEIRGIVFDRNRTPLQNARFVLTTDSGDTAEGVTDAAGRFSAACRLGKPVDLTVEARGFLKTVMTQIPSVPQEIEVWMNPTGSVRGQIVDSASKKPLSKFSVDVNPVGPTAPDFAEARVRYEPEGVFLIEDLGPGLLGLKVSAPGYSTKEVKPVYVGEGKAVAIPAVALDPFGTIRIHATVNGEPGVGCLVQLWPIGSVAVESPIQTRRADRDGAVELNHVPPGDYWVRAEVASLGRAGAPVKGVYAVVAPGQTTSIDLDIAGSSTITGTISTAEEFQWVRVLVMPQELAVLPQEEELRQNWDLAIAEAGASAEGEGWHYEITNLPAGRFQIYALGRRTHITEDNSWFACSSRGIEFADNQSITVDLKLPALP